MLAQQGAQAHHLLIRNERVYATTRIQILAVLCPTLLKTDGNTSSKPCACAFTSEHNLGIKKSSEAWNGSPRKNSPPMPWLSTWLQLQHCMTKQPLTHPHTLHQSHRLSAHCTSCQRVTCTPLGKNTEPVPTKRKCETVALILALPFLRRPLHRAVPVVSARLVCKHMHFKREPQPQTTALERRCRLFVIMFS